MKQSAFRKYSVFLLLAILVVTLSFVLVSCSNTAENSQNPSNGYGKWGDDIVIIEEDIVYTDDTVSVFTDSANRVNDKLSSHYGEYKYLDSVFLLEILSEAKVPNESVVKMSQVLDEYGNALIEIYDRTIKSLDFKADDVKLLRSAYMDTIDAIGSDALGYVAYHYICQSLKDARSFYKECLDAIDSGNLNEFDWYSEKYTETQKAQNLAKYTKQYNDFYRYADNCIYAMDELGPEQLIVLGRVYLSFMTAGVMSLDGTGIADAITIVKDIVQSGFIVNASTVEANIVAFLKSNADVILKIKIADSGWNAVYKIVDLYLGIIIGRNSGEEYVDTSSLNLLDLRIWDILVDGCANLNFGKFVNFIADVAYSIITTMNDEDLKQLLYCMLTYTSDGKYYYVDKEITAEQYAIYKTDNSRAICQAINSFSADKKEEAEIYFLDILRTTEKAFVKKIDPSAVPTGVTFTRYGFEDLWAAAENNADSDLIVKILKGIIYRYAPNIARCYLR